MTPYDAIRQILIEHIGAEPDGITPDTALIDLELDTFDLLEIAIETEELTGMSITDEAIDTAITIGDLAASFTKEAV